MTVSAGTLILSGPTNTYNGDVSVLGGTLSIASGSDTTAILNQGGSPLTYSLAGGTLNNGGTMSHLILATGGVTSALNGGTYGAGITVQSGSTLNASGSNIYNSSSTVIVGDTGSATFSVTSGNGLTINGLLGGNGTVQGTGSTFLLTIPKAGTLSPGNNNAPGVLTVAQNLSVAAGSNLIYNLGGSSNSTVTNVESKFTFGGTSAAGSQTNLSLANATFSPGQTITYELFSYSSYAGDAGTTFTDPNSGSIYSTGLAAWNGATSSGDFTVSGLSGSQSAVVFETGAANGQIDVAVTSVPEPASLSLLGLGALGLLGRRRRKSRKGDEAKKSS